MTSEKAIPLLAFIRQAYPQFNDVNWFSLSSFFTRDECMRVPSSHHQLLSNTQSALGAKKKKKKPTWESSCSLMCNLAAWCSLLCSRPQEVSEMLTKLRLNPWLRSENPSHLATFQKRQPRPEPKSPCDVELPTDTRRKSRSYVS